MNRKLIIKTILMLILILGVAMLPAAAVSLACHEMKVAAGIGITSLGLMIFSGISLFFVRPTSSTLKPREGFLVVTACWFLASVAGSLPFLISGYTHSVTDAFFESCASITTTGATIMDLQIIPRGLLLWKAVMQWLGGMGILVFVISILPMMGISGQNLFRAESSSVKMAGRISDSAKVLYGTYLTLTFSEFVLLVLGGMSVFDAVINTMSSVSTSGVFIHSGGLEYYNSVFIESVIAFFTVAVSVNFTSYHSIVNKKYREFFTEEIKVFLSIIMVASIMIATNLLYYHHYDTFGETIRCSFFQVTAIATTTGYSTATYTDWPSFSKFILFALFFIGGCTTSTSGSIKVARIIIAFKLVGRNIYQRLHPRAVVAVKIGRKAVPANVVSWTTSYIFLFILTFIVGSLVLSLQGLDLKTTISASISMLSNTGLAFGAIGSAGNFSIFGTPLRMFLCFLMFLGRLELFTVLILFTPAYWHPDKTKTSV